MTKIKGWRSEHIEIEVDASKIIDLTIDIIRKKLNLTNIDGLENNGRMYENCEYATSHSWTTREDRGEPTVPQKNALDFIKWLKTEIK